MNLFERMGRKLLAPLFMLSVALGGTSLFLLGCETTEGFGEDVEALGSEIDEEAEEEQAD
jgi:predicted small secreted protein